MKRMLLGVEIIPLDLRYNFSIIIFMNATLFFMCLAFEAFCPLGRFNFLAIFVCNPIGTIKPKHLRLQPADYGKLSKFRVYVERVYHIATLFSSILASTTWAILAIAFNTFKISWILSLFNIISVYFWTISVFQAFYAISSQALLVCYYVVRKQQALLWQIKQTYKRKQFGSVWMMLRRYDRLRGEISDYNRFWCVHITILVNIYAIITTYYFYQALIQIPPVYLQLALIIAGINSLICLCLILQFSRVAYHDRILRKHLVLLLSSPRGKVTRRILVVTQLMLQNVRSRPTGFTSIDNRLVKSKSYLEIFINMTLVFFFAFKKSKIN